MKQFIQKTLIFILLVLLLKGLMVIPVLMKFTGDDLTFFGEQKGGKPKIIMVGSSNLSFNYDYVTLNETFSNYSVIGCGLNEPSGFYATVHKLKKLKIEQGDILIFCLPHSFYEEDKLIPLSSKKKQGFSVSMLKDCFVDFPLQTMGSLLAISPKDAYNLALESDRPFPKKNEVTFEKIPSSHADSLYRSCRINNEDKFHIRSTSFEKEFMLMQYQYLKESFKGKIVFRFPPIKEKDYDISPERLAFLENNFPFINSFDSSIYGEGNWFNQWYHLNKCGQELNTQKLISELNTFFSENQSK